MYVPVRWLAYEKYDADGGLITVGSGEVVRSSVFVAISDPCASTNDPLVFLDTATLTSTGVDASTGQILGGSLVPEPELPATVLPKLPRSQQFFEWAGYHKRTANEICPLFVRHVAAAPSDPRIVYADVEALGGVDPCPQATANGRSCDFLTGIYRSLDSGVTWRLVAGNRDTQVPSEFGKEVAVSLQVSATNPYVAWVARGAEAIEAWRIAPTLAGIVGQPPLDGCESQFALLANDGTKCGKIFDPACAFVFHVQPGAATPNTVAVGNNHLGHYVVSQCSKSTAVTDLCAQFDTMSGEALIDTFQKAAQGVICAPPESPAWVAWPKTPGTNDPLPWYGFVPGQNAGPILKPPACAYHFPSKPVGDVMPLSGPKGENCAVCPQFAAKEACGAPVQTVGQAAVDCCMTAQPMLAEMTHKVESNAAGVLSVTEQRHSTGASEEWIYDSALVTTSLAGVNYDTTFMAEDDPPGAPGSGAVPTLVGGDVSKGPTGMENIAWKWKAGKTCSSLSGMAFLPGGFAEQAAAVAKGNGPPGLEKFSQVVWALFSLPTKDCDVSAAIGFPMLGAAAARAGQPHVSARALGALWSPGANSPYASDFNGVYYSSRQATAHKRLIAGPTGALFASYNGVGVFLIDKAAAGSDPEVGNSGLAKGVKYLGFGVDQVVPPDFGPAVQDITWVRPDLLFAAVGRCNLSSKAVACAAGSAGCTCNTATPPECTKISYLRVRHINQTWHLCQQGHLPATGEWAVPGSWGHAIRRLETREVATTARPLCSGLRPACFDCETPRANGLDFRWQLDHARRLRGRPIRNATDGGQSGRIGQQHCTYLAPNHAPRWDLSDYANRWQVPRWDTGHLGRHHRPASVQPVGK